MGSTNGRQIGNNLHKVAPRVASISGDMKAEYRALAMGASAGPDQRHSIPNGFGWAQQYGCQIRNHSGTLHSDVMCRPRSTSFNTKWARMGTTVRVPDQKPLGNFALGCNGWLRWAQRTGARSEATQNIFTGAEWHDQMGTTDGCQIRSDSEHSRGQMGTTGGC